MMASKLPPSRAMSLDSAVLAAEDDDQFDAHVAPLADHSDSFRKHAHIPAHALCRTKTRSYTSPHLTSRTAVGGSASKENTSNARNVGVLANGGSTTINVEPAPVIPVDVFLAGSCNPTTWRRDVAIPLLDKASIKYFNPQVDEWYEELVHEETRAKEGAKIILMVIDSATRSIVCINESVEYICRGRRLILVVQNIKVGTEVDGARITDSELADLNGARECLRRLAMRRGVRLYDDISMAVEETIECLVEENPKRFAPEKPRLRKRSSIILNEWAGQYRPRRNTSRSWSSTSLLSLVSGNSDDAEDTEGDESGSASTDLSFVHHGGTSASRSRKGSVYLGGNLQSTSWREKVAIPRLQKAGLPFYIPYQDYLAVELQRLSSKQLQPLSDRWGEMEAAREDAELILFVIPSRTRSIAAMTEAVELICNAHAMILVLEPLDEGCLLDDGHQLVGREFKDVARARVYLQEMAERHHVEVFQSVKDAVTGIIERLHR